MTTIDALMLGLLSLVCFMIARRASRWRSRRPVVQTLAFTAAITATVVYAGFLQNHLRFVHFVTGGHSIWWTNLVPVGLSLAAGIAVHTPGLRHWHRPGTVVLLTLLATGYLILPFAQPLLHPVSLASQSQWSGEVCLQTAEQSCGPAAVATLLRHHGVGLDPATIERDLALRCLTTGRGTTSLGLYRGLNESLHRSSMRVAVGPAEPARWRAEHLPALVRLRIPSAQVVPCGRLLAQPTEGHAVVVVRRRGAYFEIADPAVGMTRWPVERLAEYIDGRPLYLRSDAAPPAIWLANWERHAARR